MPDDLGAGARHSDRDIKMTTNAAETLYQLQTKDVRQAGMVLADAFRDDPIWKKDFR
jgi:hypothetical protein